MNIEFLSQGPALLVEGKERILVVADLHLGIESEMARHGIHFSTRSRERAKRVIGCIGEAEPDYMILLGDVKHSVPYISRQEYRELPRVLEEFRKYVAFGVVPGNHDPGIERFLEEGELLARDGVVIDGTGYLHGHTYPSPNLSGRLIIAGHHHPTASLMDEVGCALRAPAYLLSLVDESCLNFPKREEPSTPTRVLLMPAFNELSGYDIRKIVKDPFSPLSRCLDKEQSEIFLADGTYVGSAGSLEDHGDREDP
ncbi:metallophosphoesterase superfamily enzyme [Methanolinea mesophila]|uniref:metallophosphoesterase n=1 Tax=Methanolinea mesophila TaxID=547055 RepID=UPI001AE5EBF8|nr:metallophosphoesterase [Methanolinea mesophila]MBP1928050.1 metallophosphoesterase superfamily enzyme [Methanolinea mesophila]